MEGSLINLSKQDILYIMEGLDFDEISIPRTLIMTEDFDPINLLVAFSVNENRKTKRGNTRFYCEGSTRKVDKKAEALQRRWRDRRYNALCSLDRSVIHGNQADSDPASTEWETTLIEKRAK